MLGLWTASLFLLSASLFSFLANAAAADAVSLGDYRQSKFMEKFTGSYTSRDQQGRERISSIWIDEYGLHMWELGGFPVLVWHSFTFPLKPQETFEERRGTGVRRIGNPGKRKKYFVHTEYGVENNNALFIVTTETDADGLHKSIEERRLITDGTSLHYLFERKFYRRKYFLAGPWIEDTTSQIVRTNSKSLAFTYVKQSVQPMPFEVLQEVAEQRDSWMTASLGNPSEIIADFDWEDFLVTDEVKLLLKESERLQRNETAQVLHFPSDKCRQLLDSKK
ncbi:MAG: hypothetical protein KF799_12550 [Bdellovibrionales bacterium]|nr:hypothetical protein [Bdellovibrionales bacterium]